MYCENDYADKIPKQRRFILQSPGCLWLSQLKVKYITCFQQPATKRIKTATCLWLWLSRCSCLRGGRPRAGSPIKTFKTEKAKMSTSHLSIPSYHTIFINHISVYIHTYITISIYTPHLCVCTYHVIFIINYMYI